MNLHSLAPVRGFLLCLASIAHDFIGLSDDALI